MQTSDVSIIGSITTSATVTATSALGFINEYAIIIGLSLSLVSLIAGIRFKVMDKRESEILYLAELKRRDEDANQQAKQLAALVLIVGKLQH
jgi:Na+/melibiose symporter-like transporter